MTPDSAPMPQTAVTTPSLHPADRRLFVLDTNVLMHDPAAIFRFEEHDIFIPMVVVEERRWAVAMARLDDAAIHRLAAELPGNLTVSHKLSRALATYVERRRYLSPPRRAEIAKHLGDILLPQLKLPTSVDHDGLLCALYVRTFVAPTAREATAHV